MGTSQVVETNMGDTVADPLPSATVTTQEVVTPLTLEERVTRLENVLRDFIVNPPKLADADTLTNRIQAVAGLVDSLTAQFRSISETIPDRMSRVEARCADIVRDVESVAASRNITLTPSVRDEVHESREIKREYACGNCGTGFTRTAPAAAATAKEHPCPTCNKVVAPSVETIVTPVAVEPAA